MRNVLRAGLRAVLVGALVALVTGAPGSSQRERILAHALWIQVVMRGGGSPRLSPEEATQVRAEAEEILRELPLVP